MDSKNHFGRVIAERVFKGVRSIEPLNISEEVSIPDYRLVPRDEEEAFCKWESIRDYCKDLDAVRKPKYVEVPPLLRLYMQRSLAMKGESRTDNFRMPAYKVYTGEFADFRDFDMNELPYEEWNDMRLKHPAAIRIHKKEH
ncbi:unnamed protein product [Lepeophtheirus salmonis]|uniref:(salmon louse) hypothetical protein n=1 Tax=Lepeophtheirus salmonis TaxID=72036 RepID=A0A7R8H263_LEPSM|nr:unnamed protein product [Lepeophtheirus salmonis]CAF2808057.1 unnamed protein product [Lepeophtheirus salmonis]